MWGWVCRLTQRWEASIWLSGKQLYLGGFHAEEDAAKAYDIAAMASKGWHVPSNFGPEGCAEELKHLANASQVTEGLQQAADSCSTKIGAFQSAANTKGSTRWHMKIGK